MIFDPKHFIALAKSRLLVDEDIPPLKAWVDAQPIAYPTKDAVVLFVTTFTKETRAASPDARFYANFEKIRFTMPRVVAVYKKFPNFPDG